MNGNEIIACEKCGTEISKSQKKLFFGYCSNCFHIEKKSVKRKIIPLFFIGLGLLLFGVFGLYSSAEVIILELMSSPHMLYSIMVIFLLVFSSFSALY
jgi:hypothetical protein